MITGQRSMKRRWRPGKRPTQSWRQLLRLGSSDHGRKRSRCVFVVVVGCFWVCFFLCPPFAQGKGCQMPTQRPPLIGSHVQAMPAVPTAAAAAAAAANLRMAKKTRTEEEPGAGVVVADCVTRQVWWFCVCRFSVPLLSFSTFFVFVTKIPFVFASTCSA